MRNIIAVCVAALTGGCMTTAQTYAPTPAAKQPTREEQICLSAGMVRDTPTFNQCMASALLTAQSLADYQRAEQKRHEHEATIGAGLATEICDRAARSRISYPIKARQSTQVSGDYVKTVNISYSLDKSSENPNILYAATEITCQLRGRQLIDYSAS